MMPSFLSPGHGSSPGTQSGRVESAVITVIGARSAISATRGKERCHPGGDVEGPRGDWKGIRAWRHRSRTIFDWSDDFGGRHQASPSLPGRQSGPARLASKM